MQTDEARKQSEIDHGRRIAAQADVVWNRHTRSGKRRLDDRFADLQTYFGDIRGKTLCELGCGTGLWTGYLSQTQASVTAVDISEDLLQRARANVREPNVRFVCGDVERLPFANESLDFVCGLSILHHLDLDVTLREVHRVLKHDGRVWFSEPNMLNPQIMVQKNVPAIKRWAGDTPHETAFFRWPLAHRTREVGFRDVDVRPFDFLHPAIPAWLTKSAHEIGIVLETLTLVREIAGSLLVHARK